MEKEVVIKSKFIPAVALKEYLEELLLINENPISFELKKPTNKIRQLDPTILVAIVGALGTGFGGLITGLLQIAKQSATKKIVIQTKNGHRLEVPADISLEKLDLLIIKIKELDSEISIITLP